ncbi:hypothetical protein QAD02_012714 [Eretmocerus hayati]|uniref:Uncharacterized protein n=1 Tax=Eretmocerus hayati TaxID=131215 RepID=A0ACC2P0N3_9HYME|nr:hypothetical protein QAD02_012714 [Eretmocerus hayati]
MQEENRSMLAEHAVHIQTHPSSDAEGGIGRKIAEHDVRPVPSHNDTPGNDLHDYVIDDYEYLVDGGNDISMVNGVVQNKEPCIKKKKEIRLFERMDIMDYFIKKGLLDEDRNKDVISTHLDYIMLEAAKRLQLDSSMETSEWLLP